MRTMMARSKPDPYGSESEQTPTARSRSDTSNFGAKARVLSRVANTPDSIDVKGYTHGDDCSKCKGHYVERGRGNYRFLECRFCKHDPGADSNLAPKKDQAVSGEGGSNRDGNGSHPNEYDSAVFPSVDVSLNDLAGHSTGLTTVEQYVGVYQTQRKVVVAVFSSGETTRIDGGYIEQVGDANAKYHDDPDVQIALPPVEITQYERGGDVLGRVTIEEYREVHASGNRATASTVVITKDGDKHTFQDAEITAVGDF